MIFKFKITRPENGTIVRPDETSSMTTDNIKDIPEETISDNITNKQNDKIAKFEINKPHKKQK